MSCVHLRRARRRSLACAPRACLLHYHRTSTFRPATGRFLILALAAIFARTSYILSPPTQPSEPLPVVISVVSILGLRSPSSVVDRAEYNFLSRRSYATRTLECTNTLTKLFVLLPDPGPRSLPRLDPARLVRISNATPPAYPFRHHIHTHAHNGQARTLRLMASRVGAALRS